MPRPNTAIAKIRPVGAEQDGYFTTYQAKAVGVQSPQLTKLLRDGSIERIQHGLYRVAAGVQPVPRVRQDIYQAFLHLDARRLPWERQLPVVMLSHATAAEVLTLGNLPSDIVEVTAPKRIRTTMPSIRTHVAPLENDWAWVADGRVACATAARTVVDLAMSRISRDYVVDILDDALHLRLTTVDEVKEVLDRRRRSAVSSPRWLDELIDDRRGDN